MANVFQDQVNATGGFGGGFSGFSGGAYGIPFGVPVGGGNWGGGGNCNNGFDGLIGLAIAASLFGGGGFGGRRDHCPDGNGAEGTAALATVIAALNDRNDTSKCEAFAAAVISQISDLKGQIPAANCELLLALQNAVAGLTAQGTANANALSAQLQNLQLGQVIQTNTITTAIAGVDANVSSQGCATREAICAAKTEILTAFNTQTIQNLRDANIILANEKAELLSDARHREHRQELDGLRISIENNNTAVAAQQQFQQQRQTDLTFSRLERDNCDLRQQLNELIQINRATNQNILVGNTGVTTTGPQNANPTNVNAH
jgi:hypothetical protein